MKRSLKIAWGIGILVILASLVTDVRVKVAQPVVIQAGDAGNLDINQIVKDNLPPIQLNEPRSGAGRFVLPALILLGLTLYTLKTRKEEEN